MKKILNILILVLAAQVLQAQSSIDSTTLKIVPARDGLFYEISDPGVTPDNVDIFVFGGKYYRKLGQSAERNTDNIGVYPNGNNFRSRLQGLIDSSKISSISVASFMPGSITLNGDSIDFRGKKLVFKGGVNFVGTTKIKNAVIEANERDYVIDYNMPLGENIRFASGRFSSMNFGAHPDSSATRNSAVARKLTNYAATDAGKGLHLYFPDGTFKMRRTGTTILEGQSYMTITGAGMNRTKLVLDTADLFNFRKMINISTGMHDITMSDFAIDMSNKVVNYDSVSAQFKEDDGDPATDGQVNGIFLYSSDSTKPIYNVDIARVRIENVTGDAINISNYCQNVTVSHVNMMNYLRQGIALGGRKLRNITIEWVTDMGSPGLVKVGGQSIHAEPYDSLFNIKYLNNNVISMSYAGAASGMIKDNTTTSEQNVYVYGTNTEVSGNDFNGLLQISTKAEGNVNVHDNINLRKGIYISAVSGASASPKPIIIRNNPKISATGIEAIWVNGIDSVVIENNTFENSGEVCVRLGNHRSSIIKNNRVFKRGTGNHQGIYVYSTTTSAYGAGMDIIDGNVVVSNYRGIQVSNKSAIIGPFNVVTAPTPYELSTAKIFPYRGADGKQFLALTGTTLPVYGAWDKNDIISVNPTVAGEPSRFRCDTAGALYKENWRPSASYVRNEYVRDSTNGRIYYSTASNGQNELPSADADNTYWVQVATRAASFSPIEYYRQLLSGFGAPTMTNNIAIGTEYIRKDGDSCTTKYIYTVNGWRPNSGCGGPGGGLSAGEVGDQIGDSLNNYKGNDTIRVVGGFENDTLTHTFNGTPVKVRIPTTDSAKVVEIIDDQPDYVLENGNGIDVVVPITGSPNKRIKGPIEGKNIKINDDTASFEIVADIPLIKTRDLAFLTTNQRKLGDTLTDIIDSRTGQYLTFIKRTTYNGATLSDSDVDSVMVSKISGSYYVREIQGDIPATAYNLLPDGSTDNTIAFQKLANVAARFKKKIYFPSGAGVYKVSGKVTVDNSVYLSFAPGAILDIDTLNGGVFDIPAWQHVFTDSSIVNPFGLAQGFVSAKWFGAKGDATGDDKPAIQAAVNTVIRSSPKFTVVFIPGGIYQCQSDIAVANFSAATQRYEQVTVTLKGEGDGYSTKFAGRGTELRFTNKNLPGVWWQIGKGGGMESIALRGPFTPPSLSATAFYNTALEDYYDPTTSHKRYAPNAGIVVDAVRYRGIPDSINNGGYPGFNYWAMGNATSSGSSGLKFTDINIGNFTVGMAFSPNGQTQNNDGISVEGYRVYNVQVAIASAQDQEKGNTFKNIISWGACHTLIDNTQYGAGTSGHIIVEKVNLAGQNNQFIQWNTAGRFPCVIRDVYSETLGKFGMVYTTGSVISISDCVWRWASAAERGSYYSNWHIDANRGVVFNNCSFMFYGLFLPTVIANKGPNDSGPMFQNCYFDNYPVQYVEQSQGSTIFKDCNVGQSRIGSSTNINAALSNVKNWIPYGRFSIDDLAHAASNNTTGRKVIDVNGQYIHRIINQGNTSITINADRTDTFTVSTANSYFYAVDAPLYSGTNFMGLVASVNNATGEIGVKHIPASISSGTLNISVLRAVKFYGFMADITNGSTTLSNVRADNDLGVAVGDIIYHPAFGSTGCAVVTAISGSLTTSGTSITTNIASSRTVTAAYFGTPGTQRRYINPSFNTVGNSYSAATIFAAGSLVESSSNGYPANSIVTKTGFNNASSVGGGETRQAVLSPFNIAMYYGSGAPSSTLGIEGHIYKDTTSRIEYEKTGPSTWTIRTTPLKYTIGKNATRDSIIFYQNNVQVGAVKDSIGGTTPTFNTYKNATRDSIVTEYNGVRYAVKDSLGGGSASVSVRDSLGYADGVLYGLVGDGSTDNASALNALIAAGKKTIYLRAGNYSVGSTISKTDSLTIYGDGDRTIISISATDTIIQMGRYSRFYNLTFKGTSNASQVGISMDSVWSSTVANCKFYNLGTAIYARANGLNGTYFSLGNILSNNFGEGNKIGINLDVRAEYFLVDNCSFNKSAASGYGIIIAGGNNSVTGGNYNTNTVGMRLIGGGNNAHCVISGVKLNHNGTSLDVDGVTLGYRIIGLMGYYGRFSVQNSTNVTFSECDIDVTGDSLIWKNNTGGYFSNTIFYNTPDAKWVISGTKPPVFKMGGASNGFTLGQAGNGTDVSITNLTGVVTVDGTNVQQVVIPKTLVLGGGSYSTGIGIVSPSVRFTYTSATTLADPFQFYPQGTGAGSGIAVLNGSGNYALRSMRGGRVLFNKGTDNNNAMVQIAGTLNVDSVLNGTAGTDSVLVWNSTTKTLKKISPTYYSTSGGGMSNPMTTAGDIIVGGSSGTPDRLAKGSDGQVLKMVSGSVAWGTDNTSGGGVFAPGTLQESNDADYTIASGVFSVIFYGHTVTRNCTLPDPTTNANRVLTISNRGTGTISFNYNVYQSTGTFTTSWPAGYGGMLQSDGTKWFDILPSNP